MVHLFIFRLLNEVNLNLSELVQNADFEMPCLQKGTVFHGLAWPLWKPHLYLLNQYPPVPFTSSSPQEFKTTVQNSTCRKLTKGIAPFPHYLPTSCGVYNSGPGEPQALLFFTVTQHQRCYGVLVYDLSVTVLLTIPKNCLLSMWSIK